MITGKDLENRDIIRSSKVKTGPPPDLADRIAAARLLQPTGKELHCHDCWTRGRDAAIRLIEGEPSA